MSLGILTLWSAFSCTQAPPGDLRVPAALEPVEVARFTVGHEEWLQAAFDEVITSYRAADGARELDPVEEQWLEQLNRPHPSVATLARMFEEAADEFGVPVELLQAIAQVESNWTQVGPSIDNGYGIMHLVNNSYSRTLVEAAALIDSDLESIKLDPRQNIRAGAALLASYAGPERDSFALEDWVEPLERFSGLFDRQTRRMQAAEILRVLRLGSISLTLWKEEIVLPPHDVPAIEIEIEVELAAAGIEPMAAVDYPGAVANFTSCNFSSRGGTDIDIWTNHWIGVGTVAGAISWFKNCSADASAHFIVERNGKIHQIVRVSDKAWHAGARGYNNNERSIGVEHDATAANPSTWNDTRMLKASGEMARYFCDREGISKVQRTGGSSSGIYGHKDMPGCSTSCPGPLPWSTWMGYVNGATTGRLVGVVYEDKGDGDMSTRIGGAKVTLSTGASTTASADDAVWEFNLGAGTYTATASASGYTSGSRSCTVAAGGDTWCSIGLKRDTATGQLKGVVYVDQGNGDTSQRIPGARVKLSTGASTTARESDAFWSFSIAPGTYSVEVSADGYDTKSQSCSVTAGSETWCSVGLQPTSTCTPDCDGRACGADPSCGTSCGTCAANQECNGSGQCECVPDCGGLECGLDPVCGTSCGSCSSEQICDQGSCVDQGVCEPSCDGRACGPDPSCGESCGLCSADEVCNDAGICGPIPDGQSKVYGYVLSIDVSVEGDPGTPLAAVEVVFKDDPDDDGLRVVADENGYFELEVAPGEWELSASDPCCEVGVILCSVEADSAKRCDLLLFSGELPPDVGPGDSVTVSVGCLSTPGVPSLLGVLSLVLVRVRRRPGRRRG